MLGDGQTRSGSVLMTRIEEDNSRSCTRSTSRKNFSDIDCNQLKSPDSKKKTLVNACSFTSVYALLLTVTASYLRHFGQPAPKHGLAPSAGHLPLAGASPFPSFSTNMMRPPLSTWSPTLASRSRTTPA